jgi:uncharacterized circularly permuted ATP-grasp superfamily protein/uncharacterized alpha-E superfamily protein
MTLAAIGREDASGVLDGYRLRARRDSRTSAPSTDELLGDDGSVRPDSAALAATVDLLGVEGMRARSAQATRLLESDGVTYGSDDPETGPGPWRLDPLPVILGAAEWSSLSAGLAQRAQLMDLLLTDLYGPREVLRSGLLPAEVVYGHAGFVRQCDGLRLPSRHQLTLAATDVVRLRDGWCAMGDRTQAPSGAGYAMENRRIISRVMPGLYRDTLLERLRSFFHVVRQALQEVAPATGEAPRVVILTPGPDSETSFDQAFLSSLLGFPLVEGQDLTVRDGRLWMRSLSRPQPVDVVLRRVDSWFCDPLELRPDSRLGVPGLLQVARLGNVSIVNPPGSGVLENPGLVPFLPALTRELLGEDLALPSVPTWWCGDPVSRQHVLANLPRLVMRPIARGLGRANRFGWDLPSAGLEQLRARIEAEPHAWCAQEPLEMSTAPVITPDGLEPRRMVLRGFAVARDDGYQVMAGGLARVGAQPDSLDVSSQTGALAKDVWVIAGREALEDVIPDSESDTGTAVLARAAGLSARGAEDMFWLGRYAERAEDAARLLRVVADLAADHSLRPGSVGAVSLGVFLRALTGVTTTYPGFIGDGAAGRAQSPFGELLRVTADPYASGTLAHAVRHTVEAAYAVREVLSPDIWLVLGSLDRVLMELGQRQDATDLHLQPTLGRVLEGLLAMSGLVAEGMVRDASWYLMDAGRRIERGLQLVSLLRHTLTEIDGRTVGAVDDLVLESVLIAAESVITHRRRYPGRPRLDDVLQLLLLDRDNPRGVLHQLDRLAEDLTQLPKVSTPGPRQALLALQTRLREAGPDELTAGAGLAGLLADLSSGLTDLADVIARTHFARQIPPQPMPATPPVNLR